MDGDAEKEAEAEARISPMSEDDDFRECSLASMSATDAAELVDAGESGGCAK